jgi:hypothetical protein
MPYFAKATDIMATVGIRSINPFFAFPLKRGKSKAPRKKNRAGCTQLSIIILILAKNRMRDALAYLDEQKAACKGKNSPEGINLIYKIMSMFPRQKKIEQDQCAQEYKKGYFNLGCSFPEIFQNI